MSECRKMFTFTKKITLPVNVEKIQEYKGHTGSVYAMVLSQDSQFIFSSGDDGIVAKWELNASEPEGKALLRTGSAVYALATVGSKFLLIGTSDGTLYIFDLETTKLIKQLRKFSESIYGIFWDAIRGQVWVLYGKGFLWLLAADSFEERSMLRLSEENLRVAYLDPFSENVYIGASDKSIYLLHGETQQVLKSWEAHDNSVFSIGIHYAGKYLISGGRDAYLNVWDLQAEVQKIKGIPAHNYTVNDIAFSPSGDYFATASRDKTIKIWHAYNLELLKVINLAKNEAHKHSVNRILWLKTDNSVLSCSDDRRIIRWKIDITDENAGAAT